MSKGAKEVLIWVPLSPLHSWRGEGIAQTLEHLLSATSNETLRYTILVNVDHFHEVVTSFREIRNIEVIPLSLIWLVFRAIPKRKKYVDKKESAYFKPKSTLIDAAGPIFRKLKIKKSRIRELFHLTLYALRLKIFTAFQVLGLFKRAELIWIPVPIINWSESLKGKKVISFWDPFVFEYREFSDISFYFFKKYNKLFQGAEHIVTQSQNNKEYIAGVFKVPKNRIAVIYNGSPDYSKIIKKDWLAYSKQRLIRLYEKEPVEASSVSDFARRLHQEHCNQSALFRLSKRINAKTKVIMVSTQYRIYKGFEVLFKIADAIVGVLPDAYFIFTSELPIRLKERYAYLRENVLEIVRVSNKQHAILYCLCDLVLHPSFVEGGLGCYPQFEAASLNRPCLVNRGRHTDELSDVFGDAIREVICDFRNLEDTTSRILDLLNNSAVRQANIQANLSAFINWKSIAKKYEKLFLELVR